MVSPNDLSFRTRISRLGGIAERLLVTWGAVWIVIFALAYYSRYYRSGLNLAGEGGTVAVIAMRLMEGHRPIVDTFLGYNVMWFYPVAWLFEWTGPNYVALRIFFFALCTITGVLAFYTVRCVTRSGWYSTLAAMGPVLIPGMLFRNYMGFLALLNMLCLLKAWVFVEKQGTWQRIFWMCAAGGALGLTYLVRIDLAGFFTLILLGLIALNLVRPGEVVARRVRQSLTGLVLTMIMFGATHAPFYFDACNRGYASEFGAQYTGWINLVRYLASQQFAPKRTAETKASEQQPPRAPAQAPPKPPADEAPAPVANEPPGAAAPEPSSVSIHSEPLVASPSPAQETSDRDMGTDEYLQKRSLSAILKERTLSNKALALATYLPILVSCLIVLPACGVLLVAMNRRDPVSWTGALAVLVCTGSALVLFPQFFFFRPDTPHLSEFMVPFMVALACAVWIAICRAKQGQAARIYAAVLVTLSGFTLFVYFFHAFPKESAGTIAARRNRRHEFKAENGVRVRLKKQEFEQIGQMFALVQKHTRKTDYVVCYPYAPTINFLNNRPSYEHNLYVDNAHNVSRFYQETIEEIGRHNPAAIIIDNRAINQTDDSRFANWAASTYRWIREHYAYAGTFRRQEVYFRPDLYPGNDN